MLFVKWCSSQGCLPQVFNLWKKNQKTLQYLQSEIGQSAIKWGMLISVLEHTEMMFLYVICLLNKLMYTFKIIFCVFNKLTKYP